MKNFIDCRIKTWKNIDTSLQRSKHSLTFLHVLILLAFVTSFLGGVWSQPGNPKINSGSDLRKTGGILFVASILIMLVVVIFMLSKAVTRDQRRDPMLMQTLIALPIMLLRSAFVMVQTFISGPAILDDIWLYLALVQIPDLAVATIYTISGLYFLRPSQRDELKVNRMRRFGAAATREPQGIRGWFRKSGHQGLDGDDIDDK
jgi:hypothetical protein